MTFAACCILAFYLDLYTNLTITIYGSIYGLFWTPRLRFPDRLIFPVPGKNRG